MSPPALPSLPHVGVESAWHTYLRAGVLLIFSWVFSVFSILVFVPKLLRLAGKSGLDTSRASWLLHTATGLSQALLWGILYLPVTLSIIEMLVLRRPRWRSRLVTIVVVLFNLAALVSLWSVATAGLLEASLLVEKSPPPAPAASSP